MSERLDTIRLAIKKPVSLRHINMPLEPDFPTREFVFESIEGTGSLRDVLIYRELAAE